MKKRILSSLLVLMMLLMVPTQAVTATGTNTTDTSKTQSTKTGKWVKSKGKYKYRYSDGTYAAKTFKMIDGYWYYFGNKGNVAKGLQTIDGRKYYFGKSGGKGVVGRMKTGLKTIKGKQYYFRESGDGVVYGSALMSEWITIGGQEYYFKQDGTKFKGKIYTEQEFVDTIGRMAREDMKTSGVLASVTTAQAILESGYGRSSLGMEANNLFGMKSTLSGNTWASKWNGKSFSKKTWEYLDKKWIIITDSFRAYDSWADSIADHSAYLTGAMNGTKLRYDGIVGNKSYKKTITLIKKGGYATDPNYVSKITEIIKRFNLTQYDKQ